MIHDKVVISLKKNRPNSERSVGKKADTTRVRHTEDERHLPTCSTPMSAGLSVKRVKNTFIKKS